MKTVMFLVAGGGFQWESLALARQLADDWKFVFIAPESSTLRGSPLSALAQNHRMFRMPEISSRADDRPTSILRNIVRGVRIVWKEMRATRPDAAVCLGSSMSIPIAILCKIRGVRFIFVESITRTDDLSSTGKFLLRFHMADAVFVQWPELQKSVPGSMYRGTVL